MANTAVTISRARISELSIDEQAATNFTHKFRVLYSDIAYGTGATDTVTLTLGATPANWYVDRAGINVTTAFAGTTALTAVVGTTTTTNAFVTSQSVLTAGFLPGAVNGGSLANATGTSSLNLVAVFTNATGGSPSALSAGQADIYLSISDASKLP